MDKMTDEAKAARSAYMRAWRAKNPGKNAEYQRRFWERKAAKALPQGQPEQVEAETR